MPRKFLKRYLPDSHRLRDHRHLQRFGPLLHDPNLWHLNRRSVSGAVFIGLFIAFVPVPAQMLLAAALAILARKNLPISVSLVWVTNPVTMPPIFFFAYKLGSRVLDTPVHRVGFEPSAGWLVSELGAVWQPFLVGSLILALVAGLLGAGLARLSWRLLVMGQFRRKRQARTPRSEDDPR